MGIGIRRVYRKLQATSTRMSRYDLQKYVCFTSTTYADLPVATLAGLAKFNKRFYEGVDFHLETLSKF